MVNRTDIRRSVMIMIACLALAGSACGGPSEPDPADSGQDVATSQPEGGAASGSTDGGGSNSSSSNSGSSGGGSSGGGTDGGGTSGDPGGGGGTSGDPGGGGDGDGGGGGDGTGGAGGGDGTGGGETGPSTSPADCLYGKWSQQSGSWTLPGSSWGLSGTVTVNFASSTANTQQNVILFERNADVGRNVYTEDLAANYTQGYGNPQPSLTLSGRDYGDFSVSGSTVAFSNGSTIQMTYRMDTNPVSTKNVKRLVTTAQFSCNSTTLELSSSQFTATYKRLY
jgi:hypothetical protein